MVALLSLPQATVSLLPRSDDAHEETGREIVAQGVLALSTVPSVASSEQILLLTVGPFRYRLLPHLTLSHSSSLNTYTLPPLHPSTPSMILALPFPSSPSDSVDQSTLHTLLSGYLQILEHNPDLRGKLLLIDEDTGEVLGEIDAGELGVDDVTAEGKANEPVVIDLERVDGRYVAGIKVTEVPKEEMDDWMLKGAASISGNLLAGAGWMSKRLQDVSEGYVARATPRAEPVKISDATRANLERVNGASLTSKDGVKKVTGFLNRNIQKAAEYGFDKGQTGAIALNARLRPYATPKPPSGKRPLISRLLLAGDVLLTSVEAGTVQVVGASTDSATKSISHKYGDEAGQAAALAGGSVKNVGVAFVDARGVGRKALLKGAGKSFVKTRAKQEAGKTYGSGATTPVDVEDKVAGAQEKEGILIETLNSSPGGGVPFKQGPPAYDVAAQGKKPPPRPPTSTKPQDSSPSPSSLRPLNTPPQRSTSPLSNASSTIPSPPVSRMLSPLPPPPRRTTSPTPFSRGSAVQAPSPVPAGNAPSYLSTSPAASLDVLPSQTTTSRCDPPPPPPASRRSPNFPTSSSPLATSSAPSIGTTTSAITRRDWVRPSAPSEDDFEGLSKSLSKAGFGTGANSAATKRTLPPPLL